MNLFTKSDWLRPSSDSYDALLSGSDEASEKSNVRQRRSSKPYKSLFWLSFGAHLMTFTSLIYLLMRPRTSDPSLYDAAHSSGAYSPAEEAVEYVPRKFLNAFSKETSPYQGWPTDEQDRMWEEMFMYGITVRINKDENDRLINKTEHVPKLHMEHEHLTGLDVFHQLHCLDVMRHSVYPKRYNSSIVRDDGTIDYSKWRHIDHCIESLRQSLTCNADISAIRYKWASFDVMEPDLGTVHMCRNFSKLWDWTYARYVDTGDRRQHVENGKVVDYSVLGSNYEANVDDYAPKGWDKTSEDL